MPHIWNNILVVTESELVPAWYSSIKTLQQVIHRHKDKDYGIKKVCSGGNGRQMLVSFDSLPKEIQTGIGDPRKHDHLLELFYETDAEAVKFFTKFTFEDGNGLSLAHQEEYITNASVLRACLILRDQRIKTIRAMSGSPKKVMTSILADATSFNPTLKVKHGVEHTLPTSEKRFKEVFNEFKSASKDGMWQYNYASLISGKLRNQNGRKVTDTVMQLLNDLFAGQGIKPSRTEVSKVYEGFLAGYIECVNPATGELYNPKEYKSLSDATIINYLGQWSEAIGNQAKRSGNRQVFMQKFKPYHSLEKPQFAGSIISIDDRQPPFEYANGQRAWFYMGIDLASEAFVCWVYGKSKEGIIMDFYRQLVRNYHEWGLNLPLELEAESSLNSSFVNTFLQPGRMFEHVRIEANNARGKRIERYFGALRYGAEKKDEGWLARPFALNEANQAGPGGKTIIPYSEIIEKSLGHVENWNNQPHSEQPHLSRWEYFMANQNPNTQPTNWRAILPFLGFRTQTSCNVGIIRLQGKEFLLGNEGEVYRGQKLIDAMEVLEGNSVEVYWLDGNNGEVIKALVMMGDTIICEAIAKPKYNRATAERTETDYEARTIMSAYVSTIEAYMRDKRNSINDIVVIDNTPKPERKFKIAGINRYEAREEQAEVLGEMPTEKQDNEFTISNIKKSLKDRL